MITTNPADHFHHAKSLLDRFHSQRIPAKKWLINPQVWREMDEYFQNNLKSYAIVEVHTLDRPAFNMLYGIPVEISDQYPDIYLEAGE